MTQRQREIYEEMLRLDSLIPSQKDVIRLACRFTPAGRIAKKFSAKNLSTEEYERLSRERKNAHAALTRYINENFTEIHAMVANSQWNQLIDNA